MVREGAQVATTDTAVIPGREANPEPRRLILSHVCLLQRLGPGSPLRVVRGDRRQESERQKGPPDFSSGPSCLVR